MDRAIKSLYIYQSGILTKEKCFSEMTDLLRFGLRNFSHKTEWIFQTDVVKRESFNAKLHVRSKEIV